MSISRNDLSDKPQEQQALTNKEIDALQRAVNKIFRKGVTERLQLTLQECKNINGKKILDINCGTGQLAIQLAKRGAQVTGVDSSQKTIEMAKLAAEKEELHGKCRFMRGNFAELAFDEKFDISVALEFFDFTRDPEQSIKKMRAITREKCIMSFSAKFAFQVPLRMLWLRSRKTPIYLYTKKELKRLFQLNFSHYKIKNISAGYHCVALVQSQARNQR